MTVRVGIGLFTGQVPADSPRTFAQEYGETLELVRLAEGDELALRGRRDLRPRFEGNLLIALGVLLAAGGGVFAFLASSDKLALSLALGASVMYLGFRRASAPARPPVASGP